MISNSRHRRSQFVFAISLALCGCATNQKQNVGQASRDWQQRSAETALANSDPEVVADAIQLLGTLDATTALPLVLSANQKYAVKKTISAATATYLGKIRDYPETSLPVLADMLHDTNPSVVDAAVAAIGEYHESAAFSVPTLLELHRKGHVESDEGILVEHPPTSAALSAVGITQTTQADVIIDSAKQHGPEVFAATRGDDVKEYVVHRLLGQLSAAPDTDAKNRVFDELRHVNLGTQEEFVQAGGILAEAPSATTIKTQGKASLLLGAIVKRDPQIPVAPIVDRLAVLADSFESISKIEDDQIEKEKPLKPWQKTRLERIEENEDVGSISNPFILAIGEISESLPDAVDRLRPFLNCQESAATLKNIAALEAIGTAGSAGLRLESNLVACVQGSRDQFVLEYSYQALVANSKAGGTAIKQLAAAIPSLSDHNERLTITGILLATDLFVPPSLDQSDLLIKTRTAAKWLRSSTRKAQAFIALNECLRDGVAKASKSNLQAYDWESGEEAARRVARALTESGEDGWATDIDRKALVDSLIAAWSTAPPQTTTFPVIGPLLSSDEVLPALFALGPLQPASTMAVMAHMYGEPGKDEPIYRDYSIASRYLFWAIVLSGGDERIVHAGRWLAKDPQKYPIPQALPVDDARLTLKGLILVLQTAPDGDLRNNSVTRLDQLLRTEVPWQHADLPLLDDATSALHTLPVVTSARALAGVDQVRKRISGNTLAKKIAVLVPVFWGVLLILTLALAPYVDFFHDLLMNPWLRKFGSFGLIPLFLSIVPALREYILRRYRKGLLLDREFREMAEQFVLPSEDYSAECFGKRLDECQQLLLHGPSGIGKTAYLRFLACTYASSNGDSILPRGVLPVFIPLDRYQGQEPATAFAAELGTLGDLADSELSKWYLQQGGFVILLDGLNEVDASAQGKVNSFINANRKKNFFCVTSQQVYPLFDWIERIPLKGLTEETIKEILERKLGAHAEGALQQFTADTYRLYTVPQELEFAIEQVLAGNAVPQSTRELYDAIFQPVFDEWALAGQLDYKAILFSRAYEMLVEKQSYFDGGTPEISDEIIAALLNRKILVDRVPHYMFRHDLVRAFLAAQHLAPCWRILFEKDLSKADLNWLPMLQFAVANLSEGNRQGTADPVRALVFEVLNINTKLAGDLFNALMKMNPALCDGWKDEFSKWFGEKILERSLSDS